MISIDLLLVVGYLFFTLLIGLLSSRRVKTFREYAVGKGNISSIILSMTVCATLIGGGSSLGTATEVFKFGAIVILAKYGVSIGAIIIAYLIVPRMERFFGMLSVGEIVGSLYGNKARVITGITGSLLCIGRVGAQVMALGFVSNCLFDIPAEIAIVISAIIIIFYCSIGGVQAVVMTDILQFVALVVTIPIVLNVGLKAVNGYEGLINALPANKLEIFTDKEKFIKYLFVFAYMSLPMMSPPFVQRMLMVRDVDHVKKSFLSMAVVDMIFTTISGLIGLIAYVMYPDVSPNNAFVELIRSTLPQGLKGLAVIGILSVIMSTADSYLNVISVGIINDVIKPNFPGLSEQKKLFLSKTVTIISGVLALILALRFENIFELAVYSSNFWAPIIVGPLLLGIFGFRSSPFPFYLAGIIGVVTFLLWEKYNLKEVTYIYSIIPGIALNVISFLLAHYTFRVQGGWDTQVYKTPLVRVKPSLYLNKILGFIKFINFKKIYKFNYVPDEISTHKFSVFLIINYIFPYLMWVDNNSLEVIFLKFISGLLCVLLLIRDIWPVKLKKYFTSYWYFVLMFSIPFTNTVAIFASSFKNGSLVTMSVSIFLLSLLVNWAMFFIILNIGVVFGLLFLFSQNFFNEPLGSLAGVEWGVFTFFYSVMVSLIFFKAREEKVEKQLLIAKSIGGLIAHEIRNPLMLLSGYSYLIDKNLKDMNYIELENASKKMKNVFNEVNILVDMILVKLGANKHFNVKLRKISIQETLKHTITEYPFRNNEAEIIRISLKNDITVKADPILLKHIFFNLLQNALYYTLGRENRKVTISSEVADFYNVIIVTDNGRGVNEKDLGNLFNSFFTKNEFGTGLGLYFCKTTIESFKGKIECDSKENEYTRFKLYFPKLK